MFAMIFLVAAIACGCSDDISYRIAGIFTYGLLAICSAQSAGR